MGRARLRRAAYSLWGKCATLMAQSGKTGLEMQRRWVVHCRANLLTPERCQQSVPPGALDNKLMVDVSPVRSLDRQAYLSESVGSKQPTIRVGIALPGRGPGIHMPQFDAQHRSLESIQTEVPSHPRMFIPGLLAMTPQLSDPPLRKLRVIGGHQPAVTVSAEILGRKKTETTPNVPSERRVCPCTPRRLPGRHLRSEKHCDERQSQASGPGPPSGQTDGPG